MRMSNLRIYLKSPVVFPFIVLLISAYVFGKGYTYPSSAGKFPVFISAIIMALCIWEILLKAGGLRKAYARENQNAGKPAVKPESFKVKTLIMTLGMFLYLVVTYYIGFNAATFLYVIAASRYLGLKKWWLSIVISVLTVAFLYVVFSLLLGISFPAGILFE
jgi:hypothetical protein